LLYAFTVSIRFRAGDGAISWRHCQQRHCAEEFHTMLLIQVSMLLTYMSISYAHKTGSLVRCRVRRGDSRD
jgi:hypothetical protein